MQCFVVNNHGVVHIRSSKPGQVMLKKILFYACWCASKRLNQDVFTVSLMAFLV